jgi:hypothetical protein
MIGGSGCTMPRSGYVFVFISIPKFKCLVWIGHCNFVERLHVCFYKYYKLVQIGYLNFTPVTSFYLLVLIINIQQKVLFYNLKPCWKFIVILLIDFLCYNHIYIKFHRTVV